MEPKDPPSSAPASLEAYRAGRRKDTYIRKSMEKTQALRDLLSEALVVYNTAQRSDQQKLAFALNDVFQCISEEEIASLAQLLRHISSAEGE